MKDQVVDRAGVREQAGPGLTQAGVPDPNIEIGSRRRHRGSLLVMRQGCQGAPVPEQPFPDSRLPELPQISRPALRDTQERPSPVQKADPADTLFMSDGVADRPGGSKIPHDDLAPCPRGGQLRPVRVKGEVLHQMTVHER